MLWNYRLLPWPRKQNTQILQTVCARVALCSHTTNRKPQVATETNSHRSDNGKLVMPQRCAVTNTSNLTPCLSETLTAQHHVIRDGWTSACASSSTHVTSLSLIICFKNDTFTADSLNTVSSCCDADTLSRFRSHIPHTHTGEQGYWGCGGSQPEVCC